MVKQPFEIALYMKLVWELKPQTIIELGSRHGGTAIWLGDILHTFGNGGRVISIDIEPPSPPLDLYHTQTVHFIRGNEAELAKVELPMGFTWKTLPHPWLVINDASHVPRLMNPGLDHFDQHCCPGDVLVVEDANLTEFGVDRKWEGGPAQAISRFLNANPKWEIMTDYCDFFGSNVTCSPNGYLRRV
jgi:cephalosporin hydroxylase